MRDLQVELKALRLHGMAQAWVETLAQGTPASIQAARAVIEQLLDAERTDRAMRSMSYQMGAAKFPVHRDLAGFDFSQSPVDRALIEQLSDLAFSEAAQSVPVIKDQHLSHRGHTRRGYWCWRSYWQRTVCRY